jgi:ABC-type thiamine transport system substrate-binding protein
VHYLFAMKRPILVALLLAGCSGSNLNTSRGPNGETVVGNDVSVQITNAASPSAGFSVAEDYCRKNDRSARFVAQNGATAAFDCVKAK